MPPLRLILADPEYELSRRLILPETALNVPADPFILILVVAFGDVILISLLAEAIVPALVTLPEPVDKLTSFAAWITGAVPLAPAARAFVILPPALNVKAPELVILPELARLPVALRVRSRLGFNFEPEVPEIEEASELGATVEIVAPSSLVMSAAEMVPEVTLLLVETASMDP